MDPRWQPHLGPAQPVSSSPEACALLAAGWHAQAGECRIAIGGGVGHMVSPEAWHALRDRAGFVRPALRLQR